jgi:hypothetical protein
MQSQLIGLPVNLEEASIFLSYGVIVATGISYIVKFTVGTGTQQSKSLTLKAWATALVVTMLLLFTQSAIPLRRKVEEEREE